MGYAVIMFGVLLVMSFVVATAYNYGIAKESQIVPLKAKNIYAERETEKAQTGLTIVNTCLAGAGLYTQTGDVGPYILNLTVRNNGSIVLNPNNSTIFYNTSYVPFNVATGTAWVPLINSTMLAQNIFIYSSDANYPLRLMTVASNGITTIAPTAPTDFSGYASSDYSSYFFNWTASTDDTGIAYYILYQSPPDGFGNVCPPDIENTTIIPGNTSTVGFIAPCFQHQCPNAHFRMTAVDNAGNMGMQSVTLRCWPVTTDKDCKTGWQ